MNAPVNMDDQSGDLPANVKPMQVAINDGMPSYGGPSTMKSGRDIPDEYDDSYHDSIETFLQGVEETASSLVNLYTEHERERKVIKGTTQIGTGMREIYVALGELTIPIPGSFEDIAAGYHIAHGFYKIIVGLGNLDPNNGG